MLDTSSLLVLPGKLAVLLFSPLRHLLALDCVPLLLLSLLLGLLLVSLNHQLVRVNVLQHAVFVVEVDDLAQVNGGMLLYVFDAKLSRLRLLVCFENLLLVESL